MTNKKVKVLEVNVRGGQCPRINVSGVNVRGGRCPRVNVSGVKVRGGRYPEGKYLAVERIAEKAELNMNDPSIKRLRL